MSDAPMPASPAEQAQAELVERAVDEYVEHHREVSAQRMKSAQEALLGGKVSTLAYSSGAREADVERVGGAASLPCKGGHRAPT